MLNQKKVKESGSVIDTQQNYLVMKTRILNRIIFYYLVVVEAV